MLQAAWEAELPMVLDTEAVTACRAAGQAKILGQNFDFAAALHEEFAGTESCAAILAVSGQETALLQKRGLPNVGPASALGLIVDHLRQPP